MSHTHQDSCSTNHDEELFGFSKDMVFAILSGVFLILSFLLEKFTNFPAYILLTGYGISYFFGGYYTSIETYNSLKAKKFNIDLLMIVAAIGAAIIGEYAEGALLLFLFSLSHALEHYAMEKATKSISGLTELAPSTALLLKDGETIEVSIDSIKLDDIIVVRPNSRISVDGVVVKGESSVNQASITGESVPVDKLPIEDLNTTNFNQVANKHKVYAGTINGAGVLEIRVLRLSKDSTLSKLVNLVQEAETQKSPAQIFADRFAAIFVPSVLIVVTLLIFAYTVIDESFKESFYRAMAVLVAASPCALAISTPSAVLAGIARAARGGVLLKGGLPLQALAKVDAIAFDKTGTLTTGFPVLTKVIPFGEHTEEELLLSVIPVEELSDHPLAAAIVNGGRKILAGKETPTATNIQSLTAMGVSAEVNAKLIYIGNRRLMRSITKAEIPEVLEMQMLTLEKEGHTAMFVLSDTEYLGIVAVQDTARPEAKSSITRMKNELKIDNLIMLSGDNQYVADAIANQVGITKAYGNLLPEDKVTAIKKLKENHHIAMVGDGVNDAPAMAHSSIGISMGAAGSDVALETSDAALLGDTIEQLPFALSLARRADKIIRQNLFISVGMIAVLVPLTIYNPIISIAVIFHEGSTLLVVANALRLLKFKDKK